MSAISKFLQNSNKNIKIGVVGDILIDQYYQASVNRISPEFPIPISLVQNQKPNTIRPGGAGNVCYQLSNFNTSVKLFSLLNNESRDMLSLCGIEHNDCVVNISKTPIKQRFYDGNFPIYRIDIEEKNYGLSDLDIKHYTKKIFQEYFSNSFDGAILSDYNKGLFSNNDIHLGMIGNCPLTIVDPSPSNNIEIWKGCSIIKPNAKQAFEITGERCWKEQCNIIQKITKCQAVIITRGKDSIVGKNKTGFFEYKQDEVIAESVIGAGDCFVAILTLSLSYNLELMESIEVASKACFLYVQKKYNTPIYPFDLLKLDNKYSAKVFSPEELKNHVSIRHPKAKIVFSNGCFDIINTNHIETLKFAKAQGDILIVGIDSDENIKQLKGADRPINTLKDRIKILSHFDFIDYILPFTGSVEDVIKDLLPHTLIKGGDYQNKELLGKQFVKEIKIAPLRHGQSTTQMVQKLKGN